MTAGREISTPRRWPELTRWGACFALTLCFHAAGAAVLLARWNQDTDLVANSPVIMVEIAPVPVAPETTPNELPPGPQQTEARPEPDRQKPVEKVELPSEPQAELQMTPPPKPLEKPNEKKPKQKHASLTSAPSTAEIRSESAAAPMPGANSRNFNALPNWKSQLVARLERFKRYPSEARGEHGVAQLAFSIDRSGGAHNARIVRSSGSSLLDRETLTLVARAQPFPPPPPEVTGSQIAITVPIRYNIR
jgi:periplasmic protein TonB